MATDSAPRVSDLRYHLNPEKLNPIGRVN